MTLRILFVLRRLFVVSAVLCGCSSPTPPAESTLPERTTLQAATVREPSVHDLTQPAAGTLNGLDFKVEAAVLENGILTLRQGQDFIADRQVMLFLFSKEGELPAGRSWQAAAEPGFVAGRPHVHTSWKQAGSDFPETANYTDGFELRLELDDESPFDPTSERRLIGRIELTIPVENTHVVGQFEARVGGFVLDDGIPDRTLDSTQLLCFLGAEAARAEYGGKLDSISDRYSRAVLPEDEPKYGKCDLRIELNDGTIQFERAVFVKPEKVWELHSRKSPFAIEWRSPIGGQDSKDSWFTMPKQMATWFEDHWREFDPDATGLFDFQVQGLGTNDKVGLAQATGRIRTQWKGDPHQRRFLFRLDEAGLWQLDRLLEEPEVVDFRTGTVRSPTRQ